MAPGTMTAPLPVAPTPLSLPTPDADGVLRPYPRPENARLVSYSELQSLDCWLKHDLQYRRGLRPRARFVALQLGSAWDAFLNEWHDPRWTSPYVLERMSTPVTPEARMECGLQAAMEELAREDRRVRAEFADKDLPLPVDYDEQLRTMHSTILGMALHYRERYGMDEDWQTLGVQVWFEVPFPSRSGKRASSKFWLRGCIDRIALHLPTGRVYVIDAKLAMNPINRAYREGFDKDPQLPLYGWALQQLGLECAGGLIDASAAKLPAFPEPLKTRAKVLDPVTGEPVMEPVPCVECGGLPVYRPEERVPVQPCAACEGTGFERYKTSTKTAAKGDPKLRPVTKAVLGANAAAGTTLPAFLHALDVHGMDPADYTVELSNLTAEWHWRDHDAAESGFHWRTDESYAVFTDAELRRAIRTLVDVGPYLDTLPPTPMPSRMKCGRCSFKALCPDADDTVIAEAYTTPSEREALRERRRAQREQAEARDASPEVLAVMDATMPGPDEIPW